MVNSASSTTADHLNRLEELKLRISYRSGRDALVRDFYVPCLERATLYRRSVG